MNSGSLQVAVLGVGVLGPGLADWASGAALLREPALWQAQPTVIPPPARLPATERRRAGTVVKAAIVVADQACGMAGLDPAGLASIFTSSTGDPLNCHLLCEALATPERMVSPTRFTNSVHNAAAGYWHIATQSRAPSTSLAAFDASFGAGLLEAAVQCLASGEPVLLVACDAPYPEPLHSLRPLADSFALALVLAPAHHQAAHAGTPLSLHSIAESSVTRCADPGLEALRHNNPAARALPLLQALALAQGGSASLVIDGLPGQSLQAQVGAMLDHAGIAMRVPHAGSMCLLDSLLAWSTAQVICSASSHTDPANPLRTGGGLLAVNAIEYASQAMALHASLCAAPGQPPRAGFLASARGVRLHTPRLDTAPGPLRVQAERTAGDARQALYSFSLHDADGRLLADGRATVVLDGTPA